MGQLITSHFQQEMHNIVQHYKMLHTIEYIKDKTKEIKQIVLTS